jgi:anti-sigma factor RsiW
MTSAFASLFRKRVGCPSSQSLLDYDQSRLASERFLRIEAHLASCDFCNAELQLLTRHNNNGDEYSPAEMPAQLRTLAERFLKKGIVSFNAFPRLQGHHHKF